MELLREHDKSSETFGFVLNFLWLAKEEDIPGLADFIQQLFKI